MTSSAEQREEDQTGDRAGYHLSAAEIEFFDANGYLILRNQVCGKLLQRLQDDTAAIIAAGQELPAESDTGDFQFAERPHGRTMFRVDYIHDKGSPATLELLGSPAVLGIAESLIGPNFVPTYESMVFKQKGDGAAINWHQDAVHPRNSRIFNIDIYLDPSRTGEGALRVIPGSQRSTPDICVSLLEPDPRFGNPMPMSYIAVGSGTKQENRAMVYAGHYSEFHIMC